MGTTKIWTGATDDVFGTATNWLGGVAPVATDDVVFDRGNRSLAPVAPGFALGKITVTENYNGVIAPGGFFEVAADSILHSGGSGNYKGDVSAAKFKPRPDSKINIGGGTWTESWAQNCDLDVQAAATVQTLRALGVTISDVAGTAYTKLELGAGCRLKSRRGGLIIAKAMSEAELLGSAVLSDGSQVRSHALMKYLTDATISGLVELEEKARFTAAENSTQFTWSGTLGFWPGAFYDLDTRAGKVVPSTLSQYGISEHADAGSPSPRP